MTMQSSIRRQMLSKRRSLDQPYIDHYQPLFDVKIQEFSQSYASMAIYSAIGNEISINSLAHSVNLQKLALPKITADDQLIFVDYEDPELWQRGRYDILEPTTEPIQFVPELFFIPLTAIDYVGTRVGMGKGYYDKYLQNLIGQSIFVGVGWDFQLVDKVLMRQSHDVPMDYFISPSCILDFSKSDD